MDYSEIETTEQLLNAFKQCQNAGEEIQLFESLAERANPPVDAFVEILRKIKLETVLALAIQAFGKITDDDVKARLKGSEDLLVMLCEQAKSGATDLIRWSAATTIENVGFSFIDVSQHLTEEPSGIIQRIVQSKVKALWDGRNNDYESILRFWVYGATYELRVETVYQEGGNVAIVVNAVVNAQDIWGIKQNNILLKKLGKFDYPNDTTREIDENSLFESATQSISSVLLNSRNSLSTSQAEILLTNQIYYLNSKSADIRESASAFLCNYSMSDSITINPSFVDTINKLKNSVDLINQMEQQVTILDANIEVINKELKVIDEKISSVRKELTLV